MRYGFTAERTAGTSAVDAGLYFPPAGARRRSSSKKFSRNVKCVGGFSSLASLETFAYIGTAFNAVLTSVGQSACPPFIKVSVHLRRYDSQRTIRREVYEYEVTRMMGLSEPAVVLMACVLLVGGVALV